MGEDEWAALHRSALALRGMRTQADWENFCDGRATAVTRHVPGHALPMWRRDPRMANAETQVRNWMVICPVCRKGIQLSAKPMRLARGWPKLRCQACHSEPRAGRAVCGGCGGAVASCRCDPAKPQPDLTRRREVFLGLLRHGAGQGRRGEGGAEAGPEDDQQGRAPPGEPLEAGARRAGGLGQARAAAGRLSQERERAAEQADRLTAEAASGSGGERASAASGRQSGDGSGSPPAEPLDYPPVEAGGPPGRWWALGGPPEPGGASEPAGRRDRRSDADHSSEAAEKRP